MNNSFKISIPKPCHENWNAMTPKEKGRFCSNCAKTVVDFTKKSNSEIQDYLIKNKSQQVCGHFYKQQLDIITVEIPKTTFQQKLSFEKLFILALFIAMGTTLFSCQYSNGKKQKIQDVIIIDTLKKAEREIDSLSVQKNSVIINNKLKLPPTPTATTGIMICENVAKKDSIIDITKTENIVETREIGVIEIEDDIIIGFITPEPPRFPNTEKLSEKENRIYFQKRLQKFVSKNFIVPQNNLGLSKGKHRIYTQFTIDTLGNVTDIKVKAPHPTLKEYVETVLNKLPKFISGKQTGKPVNTKYTLPISFVVE